MLRFLQSQWWWWKWNRRENRIRRLPGEIQRAIAEIQSYSLSDVVKNACAAKDGFSQPEEMLQFLAFAHLFEVTVAADIAETVLNQTGHLEQLPSYRSRHSVRIDLFPVGISSMSIAVEDAPALPKRVRQVGETFLGYDWLAFVHQMTGSAPPKRPKVWERRLAELQRFLEDLEAFVSFSGDPAEIWQRLSGLLDLMSVSGASFHDGGPLATIAVSTPKEGPHRYYCEVFLINEEIENELKRLALATDERVLHYFGAGEPDWIAHREYWGFRREQEAGRGFPFTVTAAEELSSLPGMDIPYVERV